MDRRELIRSMMASSAALLASKTAYAQNAVANGARGM
jgi:hypothetical protein